MIKDDTKFRQMVRSARFEHNYGNANRVRFSGYGKNVVSQSSSTRLSRQSFSDSTGWTIAKLVLAILLVSVVFSVLNQSNQTLTFTSFLEWLQNFHPTFTNVTYVSHAIGGDWGLFEFLRLPIDITIQVFDFLLFLVKNLVNVLSYVTGFVSFIFV